MTEIQGKSILVRVSARFELARVRVIGSQLYINIEVSLPRALKYASKYPHHDKSSKTYITRFQSNAHF